MKKIYITRHGQTDLNLKGILQGSGVDSQLNDEGVRQSHAFFARFQHVPFKRIFTSCLSRTVSSVQGFIELGIPYEQHSGLNEISYGDLDGIASSRGEECEYRKLVGEWDAGNTIAKFPNGESPEEVRERQKSFIDLMLLRPEEDVILVSMHGRALRILLTTLLKLPLSDMKRFPHSNLGLYILNYDGYHFQIERQNDRAHLELVLAEELKNEQV